MNKQYNLVVENPQTTVVTEFISNKKRYKDYQLERELEKELVSQLKSQAYQYLEISNESDLINNLRHQLQELNDYKFSDNEWNKFFEEEIANKKHSIQEKTNTIQSDYIKILKRDTDTKETKNIHLLEKNRIHDNKLQVINQYQTNEGKPHSRKKNRYDVTILLNGLPIVHVELKRRGVPIKEAFNQIDRYKRDSFWADSGLYEYIQIFVISNGTNTKYYSNSTRDQHIRKSNNSKKTNEIKTSHSFQFASWWADAKNQQIRDLVDFTETFFSKHTLLNMLTKYCVFTSEKQLLVMRPYQIAATERILTQIKISTNNKKLGRPEAGGYIWHATGSGKTLTSFKAAQLAAELDGISKVLFVVDRKDLDYQTMKEYDKFEKGAANSTKDTKTLIKQIENPDSKIIITTIQKLNHFVTTATTHRIYKEHIVIIFDECHRSQFGKMHKAITKKFKSYHLFGFTGTPIFPQNVDAKKEISESSKLKTTERVFGRQLHAYTIVNAITDNNILPFKVEYHKTSISYTNIDNNIDSSTDKIKEKEVYRHPGRVKEIVKYIIERFDQKTKRNEHYSIGDKRFLGFNSIFTVSSIEMAKNYYSEFKRQLSPLPSDQKLKVATIFSHGKDEDTDGLIDENPEDISGLEKSDRDFLKGAINDFNELFQVSYDTSPDQFQNYYKEISRKVKYRDIDILIVVNMFLTGFDSTTLNTLWVDKNLRLHGLLQAYSRTNRILNNVKSFGNIVCFRDLEKATNESIALFGNKKAKDIVLLRSFADYFEGYIDHKGEKVKGYKEIVSQLQQEFPVDQQIDGESKQREFINLYNQFLRLRNILETFDDFQGENQIISDREKQDYQSTYLDLRDQIIKRSTQNPDQNVVQDIVFELELIKQIEINVDYILRLTKKYHEDNEDECEKIMKDIKRAIDSSSALRNKKAIILEFIENLQPDSDVHESWSAFLKEKRDFELERIIDEEKLNADATHDFMRNAFKEGEINDYGTDFSECIPPMGRFGKWAKKRTELKDRVFMKLKKHFEIFSQNTPGY
ncbi:MAG: type I restriction endonuclease subunit R [Flavobacteriaceae bacterium]|nr:type I restriction endonuclease subunit R [Flavobacteriaceae bacterium]